MDLLIIEGAGKIKKISSILNKTSKDFKVIATCGHIERLKDSEYDQTGISKELEYNFEYIDGKSKIMKEINDIGNQCSNIYIATDPDREGEGIAWHIFNKLSSTNKQKSKRITFNAITEELIKDALSKPRNIDTDYVNAYLSRIALDKKIGYGLSKYLQQKVNLPSAGRVQSVVLKLIVDRDEEIKNFSPKTSWKITPIINGVELKHFDSKNELDNFTNHNDIKFSFNEEIEIKEYIDKFIDPKNFKLIKIEGDKEIKTYPPKPYKTSTIQAEIIKELKVNSKEAEKILQTLYQEGLITYPRTDSTRISNEFCQEGFNYVKTKYENIASNEFNFNKSGSGAQDAHEAIRVSHFEDNDITKLNSNSKAVFEMIYERTIIQFMKPTISINSDYIFENNKDLFSTTSTRVIQQGFNEYLSKNKADKVLEFELEKVYSAENELYKSSTTSAPKPYSQPSLIKELEKLGIGRPSTFASSVEINNTRKYTLMDSNEIIALSEDGKKADSSLREMWSDIINYEFTSNMESSLDSIADGKLDYKQYLKEFISKFEEKLYNLISLNKIVNPSSVYGVCPKCGSESFLKETKTGKSFVECSKRKYDFKTKKISGCDYIEWIN